MPKLDKYGLPDDSKEPWLQTVGVSTLSGYAFGSIIGSLHASWSDVPVVLRDRPWPALQRTGQIMNSWGLTFAAVGASYAAATVWV